VQSSAAWRPRQPGAGIIAVGVIGLALVGAGLAVVPSGFQTYILFLLLTGLAAVWFIPRMAKREPTLSVQFLTWALAGKLTASLVRYVVFGVVYLDVGDAAQYHSVGAQYMEMVRALDFSFISPPFVGTTFIETVTAVLYAITGPTLPGAFLVFSLAAFAGAWFFYRAHRVAFPDGDWRLFRLFIFFFPTMLFWPSSLGKDALIVFGLGLSAYGLARVLDRVSIPALIQLGFGLAVTFAVRPGIAALFLFGATMGFLLHPGRIESPLTRPLTFAILGPVMLVGMFYTVQLAGELEGYEVGALGAQQYYTETSTNLETGGSAFQNTVAVTTPLGAGQALVNVLFRPLPTEASSPQEAAAALETLALGLILLWRLPASLRGLKRWRGGMIIAVIVTTLGLVLALGAFSNAGALARQRAQLLPFAFIILTAAPPKRRAALVEPQPGPPTPVPAASG
jgi:hypothetical protein